MMNRSIYALAASAVWLISVQGVFAEDRRTAQLVYLGETAITCEIPLSKDADKWMQDMYHSIPTQSEFDRYVAEAKARFDTEVSASDLVTVCWNVRDELLKAGFLPH